MIRETRTYNLNGVEYIEELIPHMYCIVETYHPHSTPWDYYGSKKSREWQNVMKAANLPCNILVTRKRRLFPMGSGPGGRIRFGDDMIPSTYRLVVPKHCTAAAKVALRYHDEAIKKWLDNKALMPEACR